MRSWLTKLRADTPTGRIARNTGWLLGGKGVGAVLSLVYLALATRTLGPAQFGIFTLVLVFVSLVQQLISFETWQAVVKFGQQPLRSDRPEQLGRLIGGALILELAGAALGWLVLFAALQLFGERIGLDPELSATVLLYGAIFLFSLRGTMMGVLRLLDRFDTAAYAETAIPVTRMIGALAAWQFMPTVEGFLIAWALSETASALAYWAFSYRHARKVTALPSVAGAGRVWREFPGLPGFLAVSHVQRSLTAILTEAPLLLVGAFVGAREAGFFRLAAQLTNALVMIAKLLDRTLFAEFSRSHAHEDGDVGRAELRLTLLQTSLFGLITGTLIVLLAWLLGRPLVIALSGPEFAPAYPLLLLLSIWAGLRFIGVNLFPAMMATDRHGQAMIVRLGAVLMLLAVATLLLPGMGAAAIAWAMIIATAAEVVVQGVIIWRAYR